MIESFAWGYSIRLYQITNQCWSLLGGGGGGLTSHVEKCSLIMKLFFSVFSVLSFDSIVFSRHTPHPKVVSSRGRIETSVFATKYERTIVDIIVSCSHVLSLRETDGQTDRHLSP